MISSVLDNIIDYYDNVSRSKLIAKVKEAKKSFNTDKPYSIFKEFYGLGFPFYMAESDISQIKLRLYYTIKNFLQKGDFSASSEQEMVMKLLPDIDTLIIYDSYKIGSFPNYPSKNMFKTMIESFFKYYHDIFFRISLELKKHKLIIGEPEYKKISVPFLTKQSDWNDIPLQMDMVIISKHVWDNMIYFITDEDVLNLFIIRDILFTSNPLDGPSSPVVDAYRMNFLLFSLKNSRMDKFSNNKIADIIFNRHPYSELINKIPAINLGQRRLWNSVIGDAVRQGFLIFKDGLYELSPAADKHLDEILSQRDRIIDKGFDLKGTGKESDRVMRIITGKAA